MLLNVIESYDLKRLQELTGFSRDQINRLVEKKFLTPEMVDKKPHFSYLDVSMINAIKSLYSLGVSKKQIHRNLELVRDQLDANKPLSTATFRVIDGRLIYDDGKYLYCLQTGQYLLDLDVSDRTISSPSSNPRRTKLLHFADRRGEPFQSTDENWYNLGVVKENETKPLRESESKEAMEKIEVLEEEAMFCYKRELELKPQNFDAMINLGRLYQSSRKDLVTARACYESVVLHEPEDNIANFNLGTVWDQLQNPKRALEYYDQAPFIPDSYFNKGRILELLGRDEEAAEQFRIYHKMMEELGELDDSDEPEE